MIIYPVYAKKAFPDHRKNMANSSSFHSVASPVASNFPGYKLSTKV